MRFLSKSSEPHKHADAAHEASGVDALKRHGLYADWYMTHRLAQEVDRARRYGRPLSVIVASPALLPGEEPAAETVDAAVAAAEAVVRSTDILGWHGRDFLVILPETNGTEAEAAAARWRSELYLRTRASGGIKWTAGVAEYVGQEPDQLVQHARENGRQKAAA